MLINIFGQFVTKQFIMIVAVFNNARAHNNVLTIRRSITYYPFAIFPFVKIIEINIENLTKFFVKMG